MRTERLKIKTGATYQPDKLLRQALREKLDRDDELGSVEQTFRGLEWSVDDGIVSVRGHVRTRADRERLVRLFQEVPGVRHVEACVVADDELSLAVAQALAANPQTRGEIVWTSSYFGHVHLAGAVQELAVSQAAQDIAACMPGSRAVLNYLRAPGQPLPDGAEWPLLEPRVGQPVYTSNVERIGQVCKVAIDPRSRRVDAIVVEAQPANGAAKGDPWAPAVPPVHGRLLVIGLERIDRVAPVGVFLNITAGDRRALRKFDPNEFRAPDAGWEPPFPYRREEIACQGAVEWIHQHSSERRNRDE